MSTTLLAGVAGLAVAALIAAGLALSPQPAAASAKWAKSTGKASTYCHSKVPALNARGKAFQASGHKL